MTHLLIVVIGAKMAIDSPKPTPMAKYGVESTRGAYSPHENNSPNAPTNAAVPIQDALTLNPSKAASIRLSMAKII